MTGTTETLNEIIAGRMSRRGFFVRAGAVGAAVGAGGLAACSNTNADSPSSLTFQELTHHYTVDHRVAEGYRADVLLRWGDVLMGPNEPEFGGGPRNGEEQERRFGMNCDYIGFFPLPLGSNNSDHGLLTVNHEYPSSRLAFPGFTDQIQASRGMSERQVAIEMAALGLSVVEVKLENGRWMFVKDSPYNRRIHASTPIEITGPAAGHTRLQTADDPTGTRVLGTFANCAGGYTPWGTVLTAEENFDAYFWGDLYYLSEVGRGEERNLTEFAIGARTLVDESGIVPPTRVAPYAWSRFHERFDVIKHPREPNRFGYVVEIDPFDPQSVPKKRTALGRFKHECATVHAEDGKPVVVYTTDDARDQFVYRFISKGTYKEGDRAANMDLLSEGDLYVAKYRADGTGEWIKIAFTDPWLTPEFSGLKDEAELLIETRFAARLLGATPMDRPEDLEVSPKTGRIYLALTSNDKRSADRADASNPRAPNLAGHIIEMFPPGKDGARDHWAATFTWDVLLLAGNPDDLQPSQRGVYHPQTSPNGWFTNPDNLAIDRKGRLWISTDGFTDFIGPDGKPAPRQDGLWATDVTGDGRALTRYFYSCPRGAEATGPFFTPDSKTLFISVQHPGDDPGSRYSAPSSRWPDFDRNIPPRSSVVAITRDDGGEIGG